MSTTTTLHNTAKSKVETVLLDVTLTTEEVAHFTPKVNTNTDDDKTT